MLGANNERIAVASHFYKIIIHEKPNGFIDVLAIMLPHNNQSITGAARKPYLTEHITTIDQVEDLTGINFLSELGVNNPRKEAAVEGFKARQLWW